MYLGFWIKRPARREKGGEPQKRMKHWDAREDLDIFEHTGFGFLRGSLALVRFPPLPPGFGQPSQAGFELKVSQFLEETLTPALTDKVFQIVGCTWLDSIWFSSG